MTGARPAGRPWTLTDDDMLRELLASGMKPRLIAPKLKRSIGAIQSRIFLLKKPRKRLGLGDKMNLNMAHRQVMQYLRSGEWKFAARLPVLASEYALDRMVANGWMERRGSRDKIEIRLTTAGLDALKAPVRQI